MQDKHTNKLLSGERVERRTWTNPAITDLPPLQDLTLQTGGIPGGDAGFSWIKTLA